MVLKPKNRVLQVCPLGYHINITAKIQGQNITRCYTTVPQFYTVTGCPGSCLGLLVKRYPQGLSNYLTREQPLANSLIIFQTFGGNFSLHQLKNHCRIGLLAAGSGITPMLGLLDYLVDRTSNKL